MDTLSKSFVTLEVDRDDRDSIDGTVDERIEETLLDKISPKKHRGRSRRRPSSEENSGTSASSNDKRLNAISLDELAHHDSADDCWVAIYDYVYDCTEFAASHPGGHDVLHEYAGRDATLAFIGTGHSVAARKLLDKYLIGELPAHERIFRTTGGVKIVQH